MNTKRNVYLNMKPLDEALKIFFDHFPATGSMAAEWVSPPDAVGRVLAEPVFATVSSPNFHAAAMDGVAVKAVDTFGASQTRPKELAVGTQAKFLNTGHVMPEGTDAVIMIENIQTIGEDRIRIEAPAFPWQHVRKMGEDIVATELLYPRGHVVTPYCIGALIAGGVYQVPVRRKPRVLILPTGSELVDWRVTDPKDLKPGQVLESNAFVLERMIQACGAEAIRHDRVIDDLDLIRRTVADAVAGDVDMVMTIGGSSAGSKDYALPMLKDLGEMLVHGVTIMPGKPVILGDIQGKPFFGIPGYPVSAIIICEQFVQPLIKRMIGVADDPRPTVAVVPTRKIASKLGVEEFLRVKLGQVGENIVATPLPRGAGTITSITEADGIIRIPRQSEGIKDNDPVVAELIKPLSAIKNTIVIVGSHDNTLDVLADQLRAGDAALTLSSSHVGSMGGLMAVKRGVCHLAGAHLLDTETGLYNLAYIRRYLPDTPVRLVNLVMRDQGLIIPKGNPKGIQGIEDLGRDDITFINRQGGSGTRILLDYRLGQIGLSPENINGYSDEEFTHMNVAVAVLSGSADAGLGIYAAAKALDLDFIPVVTEQYDLVIPQAYLESRNIQTLLATIQTPVFKKRVEALGGYSMEKTGTVTTP
ncbi:molybdopterin biosynthesis protein [Desulfosarcina ovata subsp. sediminis]|uniref:Molybdopterin molybdenumtransferase n=1 Tax=Desulfosarcina ovata subsp. sediminis TaxID=885957 RepID=A0A5K7ZX69_9BACT|nr:molybdopterin biosynthesis protein [Desulfosarcina ovata]BBO84855.1 molybdopterin biosynthesis protein [Desulfosarcina ovata subsp. sediminis]